MSEVSLDALIEEGWDVVNDEIPGKGRLCPANDDEEPEE